MTTADQRNVALIVVWQQELAAISAELGRDLDPSEIQDQINLINSRLDTRAGIVAGDGCYYPRAGFPE